MLVRRGREPLDGYWSIPGGVVETGELLINAVKREILEETGLTVEPLAVVEVFERITPDSDGKIEFHFVVVDYVCRLIGHAELMPGDDAVSAAWFPLNALPEQITEGAPRVIEKASEWLNLKS